MFLHTQREGHRIGYDMFLVASQMQYLPFLLKHTDASVLTLTFLNCLKVKQSDKILPSIVFHNWTWFTIDGRTEGRTDR